VVVTSLEDSLIRFKNPFLERNPLLSIFNQPK